MKPKDRLLTNLAQLFNVKSLISLVLVMIFTFKVITGADIGLEFLAIFTVVITYWLCERTRRKEDDNDF